MYARVGDLANLRWIRDREPHRRVDVHDLRVGGHARGPSPTTPRKFIKTSPVSRRTTAHRSRGPPSAPVPYPQHERCFESYSCLSAESMRRRLRKPRARSREKPAPIAREDRDPRPLSRPSLRVGNRRDRRLGTEYRRASCWCVRRNLPEELRRHRGWGSRARNRSRPPRRRPRRARCPGRAARARTRRGLCAFVRS